MKGEAPRLELPEGATKDPFKARVAVVAAAITLVGTVTALLHSMASTEERVAAREAQRKAVVRFGLNVRANEHYDADGDGYVEAERYKARQRLVTTRARMAPGLVAERLAAENEAWERAKNSIVTSLTRGPTESTEEFNRRAGNYAADLYRDQQLAALEQESKSRLADDWSTRADSYVVVLTLIAAALFLLGLSATVERSRALLAVPGVVLGLFCLGRVVQLGLTPPTETPNQAIALAAEGQLLAAKGEYGSALASLNRAIDIRPSYGLAYLRRAGVYLVRGSPQQGAGFVSIAAPEDVRAYLADLEQAARFGTGGEEFATFGDLGFAYFLVGRYDDAEGATARALELNDALPELWFNLGVILLAQGEEAGDGHDPYVCPQTLNRGRVDGWARRLAKEGGARAAQEAYECAIELTRDRPYPGVRTELYRAARTDVELLVRAEPKLRQRANRVHERLTVAELEQNYSNEIGDRPLGEAPDQVRFSSPQLTKERGERIRYDYRYENIEKGDRVTHVWFRRQGRADPWDHVPYMTSVEPWALDSSGPGLIVTGVADCPIAGEYRVDTFVESELVSQSVPLRVEDGPLGPLAPHNREDLGFYACRPEGWVTDALGPLGVRFRSPAGELSFSIETFPLGRAALGQPESAELRAIRQDPPGEPVGDVGSLSLRVWQADPLQARVGCFHQDVGGATVKVCRVVSVGPDGVMRKITARAPLARLFDLDELLATLVVIVRSGQ